MNRIFIIPVLMFIALTTLACVFFTSLDNKLKKDKEEYKTKVGQTFIINKDTLIIVNYSTLSETFTLSDGRVVSSALILNKDN